MNQEHYQNINHASMNVSLANDSKKYNSSQKWNNYKMKYKIK